MENSLEKAYQKHANKFIKYLNRCSIALRNKDIHRLRVSIKHMQATFELAQFIHESPLTFKIAFQDVRQVFKAAGMVRENQLNRKLAKDQKESGLKSYRAELNEQKYQGKKDLVRELRNFNIENYWQETDRFLETLHPIKEKKLTEETVRYIQHKEALIREIRKNQEGAEGYHEIRKYLKQIGIILTLLKNKKENGYGKKYLSRFVEVETLIGEWHDIEILKRSFQTYKETVSEDKSEGELNDALSQLANQNRERLELIKKQLDKLIPATDS